MISNGRLKRAGPGRWSKSKERAFLAELAYSGSARRACRAIGMSKEALSRRRKKDAHFAAAWNAAVEAARRRLEGLLVEAGNETFDPDDLPEGEESQLPKVTVAEAIQIVKLKGPPSAEPAAVRADVAGVEEVHAALVKALVAFGGRVAKEDDLWERLKASGVDPNLLGPIDDVQVAASRGRGNSMSRSCPCCRQTLFLSFPAR